MIPDRLVLLIRHNKKGCCRMENKPLNDKELEMCTGGFTNEEIRQKINQFWLKVPESMRNEILEMLEKSGKKAARSLVLKFAANMDWMQPMADLFD